ncbi:TPA: hypothetical protein HA249_07000 [Candidatus Woesearchaeota archaeon]|nr:hypothetical protein [Candidatus Woesearchaeota archaeon]HIH47291.1 hypothetical protein [Candidatus Woesearchaeota archaeon]HII89089.1 hypothetical protein [Candidatus Woesearchaeota archaeon]
MGRYSGHIKRMPTSESFGEIYSNQIEGLVSFFDLAEGRRAKGPGKLQSRTRVTFEVDGRGRAVGLIKSQLLPERRGIHKDYQRSTHRGY